MSRKQIAPAEKTAVQISDELRTQIVQNKYSPGQLIPSLRELTEEFSVGIQTARSAINLLAGEGTIAVRHRRRGFVIRKPERKREQRRLIGMVLPSMHFEFFGKVTEGMLEALDKHNKNQTLPTQRYRVISVCSMGNSEVEGNLLSELADEVDGIVLFPVHTLVVGKRKPAPFETVALKSVPLMLIGRTIVEFEVQASQLTYPEAQVGEKVAEIVLKIREDLHIRDNSRIYVVGERRNSSLVERANGITRALEKRLGEEKAKEIVVEVLALWDLRERAGQWIARELIDKHRLFENRVVDKHDRPFIVCTTDLAAMGLIHEFRLNKNPKISVPDDVLVMGVDGDLVGVYSNPSLTTLRLDPSKLGHDAAIAMLSLIEKGSQSESARSLRLYASKAIGSIINAESTEGSIRELPTEEPSY